MILKSDGAYVEKEIIHRETQKNLIELRRIRDGREANLKESVGKKRGRTRS